MSTLVSYAQSLGMALLTNSLYEFWNTTTGGLAE